MHLAEFVGKKSRLLSPNTCAPSAANRREDASSACLDSKGVIDGLATASSPICFGGRQLSLLEQLPEDMLAVIFGQLPIDCLGRLAQCSKNILASCKQQLVWSSVARRQWNGGSEDKELKDAAKQWKAEGKGWQAIARNSATKKNWPTAFKAALDGKVNALECWISDMGVSVDLQEQQQGWSLLHCAVDKDHLSIVQHLVEKGANVNMQTTRKLVPLHLAASKGYTEMLRRLIEAGASVDISDQDSSTALHVACRNGHVEVVKELIKAGAHVDAPDSHSWTPLHHAIRRGHLAIVVELAAHGANVHKLAGNARGATPLLMATQLNELGIAQYLLSKDCNEEQDSEAHIRAGCSKCRQMEDPDTDQSEGKERESTEIDKSAALVAAVRKGFVDMTRMLIDHGADPNSISLGMKASVLHFASADGNVRIVNQLLQAGASPDVVDQEGRTPLEYAQSSRRMLVCMLLKNANSSSPADVQLPQSLPEVPSAS